jgi:hypothetical protein
MMALSRKRLLWLLAPCAMIGGAAWLGWAQAGQDLARAAAAAPRSKPGPALTLPQPPAVPSADNPDASAPIPRSAIPPPGGYPVDVLQEMWEAALKTPRKVGDTPLTAENWFITGVFTRGAEQEVIVQHGNDPKPHFHKVGDTLPGGARIAWVKPNVIGLITPGSKRIALPLAQPVRDAASAAP